MLGMGEHQMDIKDNTSIRDGLILCMDIGGTHIRSGFVDYKKNVYEFNIGKSADVFLNTSSPVQSFVSYIQSRIDSSANLGKPLMAISIGFPSTVSHDYRKLLSTPNLPGLDNVNMANILEEKFKLPAIVSRDVCMLMYYDMYTHNIPKDVIVIACYIGTGYGNSIYIDGKLLMGKNGVAAELGHMPVQGVESVCSCGNKGCIETIGSGKYLCELHQAHFSDVAIDDVFVKYGTHKLLCDFVETLTLPVAAEINIFDPHYVLLGGGVLQMNGFPQEAFQAKILARTRKPLPAQGLEFIYPAETKSSGVIGAGIFGFEQLIKS